MLLYGKLIPVITEARCVYIFQYLHDFVLVSYEHQGGWNKGEGWNFLKLMSIIISYCYCCLIISFKLRMKQEKYQHNARINLRNLSIVL